MFTKWFRVSTTTHRHNSGVTRSRNALSIWSRIRDRVLGCLWSRQPIERAQTVNGCADAIHQSQGGLACRHGAGHIINGKVSLINSCSVLMFLASLMMGASSSHVSELSTNEQLLRLASTECLSPNDPFWNQLLSFTFIIPRNRYSNCDSSAYLLLCQICDSKQT